MEIFVSDKQILQEVKGDIDLLTAIQHRILSKNLHRQIMDLATDAVENEKIQINSVEDLATLIELDLLLSS